MLRTISAAAVLALISGGADAEVMTACLRGNTGEIIKAQIGDKPTNPCIAWQKQVTYQMVEVRPSPQEMRRGLTPASEPSPITTTFRVFIPYRSTHMCGEPEQGPCEFRLAGSPELELYGRCAHSPEGGYGLWLLVFSDLDDIVFSIDGGPSRPVGEAAYLSGAEAHAHGSPPQPEIVRVPDVSLLAFDGTSISIHDAELHIGAGDGCTVVGMATVAGASG